MYRFYILAFFAMLFCLCPSFASAQNLSRDQIIAALEKDGCVTLEADKVKICKYDYSVDGYLVEGISFQPIRERPSPGIMLIPGYQGSASLYIRLGSILAKRGFACLAVAQPGFGKSQGKPDFVGPYTIKALTEGLKKFQRESYVNAEKIGIFGYSRGAIAASLLAVKMKEVKATVWGGGIYDFKKAYDESPEGIRKNMEAEAGLTPEAVNLRSPLFHMEGLHCPVLILHGGKDENASVNQAYMLRDRLTELKKDFEIRIFPNEGHGVISGEFLSSMIDFFNRKLLSSSSVLPNN